MAEYAKYYVEFLWSFVQNVWQFIYSILYAFYKFIVLDLIGYFKQLGAEIGNFDVLGWILLIVVGIINFTLVFFLVYRLCQLIRRYILFRAKEVDKDKLMEEIAILKEQAEKLTEEKNKIFALKVGSRIYDKEEERQASGQPQITGGSASAEAANKLPAVRSRFSKLVALDEKYTKSPRYIFMDEADLIALPQIIDRFVNFAASQLHLYYKKQTIMQFFAGLATSKIIVLEGISGTGKTSLPYAMSKFFNNDASIISVQPSWRDRAELIGYFNEFTKKFNETDFLASLYEATLREDPNFIVLDEMNLARIEYYFADFLSIMEMPDIAEWKIDIISESLDTDPKNVVYGKLLVPQNVWFIGTANNDDSTFTITDKVYDRAVALALNEKADYFDAPMTESYNCSYNYIDGLFEAARAAYGLSDKNRAILKELDAFIQAKFKIAFGNRILKQIDKFIPVYIACGGTELDALDFMIATKILRKFNSLNLPFLTSELNELNGFFTKKFGKNEFNYSREYIKDLLKMNT